MKKSIVFLGLMLVSSVIFAQDKPDPKARAAQQTEKMKTELALTDEQYASVKSINEDYATKQSALRENTSLSREDKMKQMRTMDDEKKEAIKKVLTADQNTKWEAAMAKQGERGGHGGGQGGHQKGGHH